MIYKKYTVYLLNYHRFQKVNMLKITDLPEEVIIIIIKKLDIISICNLYDACKETRRIAQLPGVVKTFNISMTTMATVHSFKLNFFKDVAYHLQELNVCGVPDLTKTSLLSAIRKLKCLRTLDVSYTDINIMNFIELHPLCPTIKNISINFVFGKLGFTQITSNTTITECQNIFEKLENVHFIGSLSNLLYSPLPFSVLEKCNLKTLKYSVAECDYVCTTSIAQNIFLKPDCKPNISFFNIWLLNWKEYNFYYHYIKSLSAVSMLNLGTYEFIIITMMSIDRFTVFVSPRFLDFFRNHFDINVECTTNFENALFGNVSIMIWKKESNKFDSVFYNRLLNVIKPYFPRNSESGNCAPPKSDWFYIVPQDHVEEVNVVENCEPEFRKKRIGAPRIFLNYDDLFQNQEKFKLSIMFRNHMRSAITIKTDFNYLKKLTFVSITGQVRYNSEFFYILLLSSTNLITLNVESSPMSACGSAVSRAIPLSRSLKHLRLVDREINFKLLFSSLSRCLTIENICIFEDSSLDPSDLSDPSIVIEKCDKLYNFYIEASMSENVRLKKQQIIKQAKEKWKRYALNMVLHVKSINNKFRYCYDPFISVFNLSPIKPVS